MNPVPSPIGDVVGFPVPVLQDGNSSSLCAPMAVSFKSFRTCFITPAGLDVGSKRTTRAFRHYSPKARVVLFEPTSNPAGVMKHVLKDLKDTACYVFPPFAFPYFVDADATGAKNHWWVT
jgi:hypothetical protein